MARSRLPTQHFSISSGYLLNFSELYEKIISKVKAVFVRTGAPARLKILLMFFFRFTDGYIFCMATLR